MANRNEYTPQSIDENGNPIKEIERDSIGRKKPTGRPQKVFDSEEFHRLFQLYNTIGKNGNRMLSKSRFAEELGISRQTLNKHLKTLKRDGRLDEIFKDEAVIAIRQHEKEDTPENILARMGIM